VEDLALLVAVGVNEEGYRGHGRSPYGGWGEEGGVAEPAEGAFGAGASRGGGGGRGPPGGVRGEAAGHLARGFVERYQDRFKRAVEVFAQGLAAFRAGGAFPGSAHRASVPVKRRTKVVGVFPNEGSLANLATVVVLKVTEDWAFRRYMDMAPLWAAEGKPTKIAT